MKVADVAIDSIVVGERRREDFGDIASLAKSIENHGLLFPVILCDGNRLVAGERRLRAAKRLGWKTIPACNLGKIAEKELRSVELEENIRRKQLTDFETAKRLRDFVDRVLTRNGSKPPGVNGRPKGGTRQAAREAGIPLVTVQRATNHANTADRFPWMKPWKQSQVLAAAEHLDRVPEPERAKVAELAKGRAGAPAAALDTIRNVASKPKAEREAIYSLVDSPNPRDREKALALADNLPPPPDPRIIAYLEAATLIEKSTRARSNDSRANRGMEIARELRSIVQELRKEASNG